MGIGWGRESIVRRSSSVRRIDYSRAYRLVLVYQYHSSFNYLVILINGVDGFLKDVVR